MQLSNRSYIFMNTFAIFAPIVSAVLAAANYEDAVASVYWMALFVAIPVVICLLAAKLIKNQQFYIGATVMMFTCNLMNTLLFHMDTGAMMIVSVLLLQLFIAVPSLLYGMAVFVARKKQPAQEQT